MSSSKNVVPEAKEALNRFKMEAANEVGVNLNAAVQVGMLKRVVVVDVGDGLIELINPEIVESDGVQYEIEGCLSLPGKSGVTVRPKTVKVRAQNREGKWCLYKGEDLKARAFCHEIDHLDGHLYIERLAPEEVVERIRRESGRID